MLTADILGNTLYPLVEMVFLSKCQLSTSESILIDVVYAAAHRQCLSHILPGALTSGISQTVSLTKCHCKTCHGNDHFLS